MIKFANRVGDKLLDTLAGLVATFLLTAAIGVISVVLARTTANPQSVLTAAIVALVIINIILILRLFQAKKQPKWNKSGNLWWLCDNLARAMNVIRNERASKMEIDHILLKCHHHATKLDLDDDIVPRLQRIRDEARNYSISDWTEDRRNDVTNSLQRIYDDAGQVAQRNQPNFDPGPNLI